MKDFSSVMVLTDDEESKLVDALFNLGYVPLIRKKMTSALRDIHHKCVALVFLDLNNVDIDALEFVINVRDIDQELPIIIVNGRIEGKKEVLNQKNIYIVANVLAQIKSQIDVIL